MIENLSTGDTKSLLFLTSNNNKVVDASDGFVNLSGYSLEELLGKSLGDIGRMVRIDSQVMLEGIQDETRVYLFNKSLELREVVISCEILEDTKERRFYFKQHSTARIEDQFKFSQQLYTNRETGVTILSFPDLVFLKICQNYLDKLESPYNKREHVIGKSYNQIAPKHISSLMKQYKETIQKTGKPCYEEEKSLYHPLYGIQYWNVSTVPVFQEGEIKYLVHSTLDVTKKVVSYQSIEQKNKELEAVIENISEELLVVDKDGQLVRVNKAARSNRLYDFTLSNMASDISKQVEVFNLDKEIIPFDERPTQKVMRQERFSAYRIIMKNSKGIRYKEVSGTPIYDSNNEFMAGVLIYRDISSLLTKEENILIKTQYDLLNRIIENLELGLVRYSYPDFKVIDMNTRFRDSFVMNQSDSELELFALGDHKNFKEKLKQIVENTNGIHSEIMQFDILGQKRFFKFIYQPLLKLNNGIKEIIVMAVEITEEVTEKNKLEQILKIQEEVFMNVSHECRTPLNLIFSTCQLMELYLMGDMNEEVKNKMGKGIHSIKQNCNRFIKIVNNVIDLSQIESGDHKLNLSNEDIVKKIQEIVDSVLIYAKERGLNIILDTNIKEKYIAVDMGKIERAMLNLISNAIKFSDNSHDIYIEVADQGETVAISVSDKGMGIEEKYLESIFAPFSQVDKSLMRAAEGSGIGLSLVKAIVEMHGGKVSVESQIGQGSRFKIELPVRLVKESQELNRYRELNEQDNRLSVEFSDIY